MDPTVIHFNPSDPNLRAIRDLAQYSRVGRIVAFPTETVYGIGAPASQTRAIEKLYHLKGRDPSKPLAYHIGGWEQLAHLNIVRNAAFRCLSKKFWPGPLTLVVQNEKGEKIGVRYPRHIATTTLIMSVGEPFLATSANKSGEPAATNAQEVIRALGGEVDFVIDAGPCALGADSTVVDLTNPAPEILREGAEAEAVRETLGDLRSGRLPRKKILLVCTGNSCRTPMAAGLIQAELKRKRLEKEIEIETCGILARDGVSATPEAVYVMKNREIDISAHRSCSCRKESVLDADLILAMSQDHYDFLAGLVPNIGNKIKVLDIPDPVGQGISVYEETVERLEKRLKEEWEQIIK